MTDYIDTADVAKMLRRHLKRAFPGIKFSVRMDRYAGGCSIDVRWTDGPSESAVNAIARNYQGGRFDGSIDLAYQVTHYLLPDGTVTLAESPGSQDSAGADPKVKNWMPEPGSKRVRLMADHVFCCRNISEGYAEACRQAWDQLTAGERCELLNNPDFPRWCADERPGEALARYLSQPKAA